MEFDKSRVYTALNADELKPGSKVIAANNIDSLKCKVNDGNEIIKVSEILEECYERRFQLDYMGTYPFVYLVSEPEEKKLKWTDLKFGDIIKCKTETRMVTGIDTTDEPDEDGDVCHICAGGWWSTDKELEEWEKVE